LAYEAAEKAGILHLTTGENVSADAKLNHFKLLFIVDDETRVFGIKPPSTRIRLLPKEELRKDMYPAEGDVSKLVYQWPRGGDLADVAYTDVAIRRKDLRRVICQVVWEGRSREAPPYPDLWHERAMLKATLNVRCSRRSRRRCCGAVTTGFDPKRKSGGPKCCDAQPGFFDDG
jgi:hypothetical protein